MITDFTPGAYMVHDMLHMRGGHQVNWFFDGIPVINTNIAANVAPLINPKNVEELEIERGGFSSEYGDRTYGFFNVVTPSGFERNNEAEVDRCPPEISTPPTINSIWAATPQRFAYYASVDGNRSELGLALRFPRVIHDQDSGVGGFLSLLYNPDPRISCAGSSPLRGDHYQIPNTPDQQTAASATSIWNGITWPASTGPTRFSDGSVHTRALFPLTTAPIISAVRMTRLSS